MKTKITTLVIFAATAATVSLFPYFQNAVAITPPDQIIVDPVDLSALVNEKPKIEVVFVLDTTGSMGGLIHAAKEKIWSIASTMASAQSAPEIKMGLVAYRDRGDNYITKTIDLSTDLDSMYATLMDFKAQGGGDGPESVNQALDDAVNRMSWSQDDNTYKVVFLVGDAPAHMDYQDDIKYPETLKLALGKGIKINAIQCGRDTNTTSNWQQIASLGQGAYFQVEQAGSAIAIATPFDRELAKLSATLDDTRLYFGNKEEKERQQNKVAASRKLHLESSEESLARRATFNTSKSGDRNFLGENELIDAISSGRVELSAIDKDNLPAAMQSMAPEEQKNLIEAKAKQRTELRQDIQQLAEKRDNYLKKEVAKAGGEKESLDNKIYSAIRKQSEEKGLIYSDESARY